MHFILTCHVVCELFADDLLPWLPCITFLLNGGSWMNSLNVWSVDWVIHMAFLECYHFALFLSRELSMHQLCCGINIYVCMYDWIAEDFGKVVLLWFIYTASIKPICMYVYIWLVVIAKSFMYTCVYVNRSMIIKDFKL